MSDEAIEYQRRIAREQLLVDATFKYWFQKRWFILRVMAVAVLVFAAILLLIPKSYRAEASIIVMPPRFIPEIRTQPFSITTTQKLLETPELYQQVILRLRRYRHVITRLVGNATPTSEVVGRITKASIAELMSDSRVTNEEAQAIAELDSTEIRGLLEFNDDELQQMNVDRMASLLSSRETVEKKTASDLIYSPVLKLYAVSDTGNKAQVLVNLWAKLFETKYESLTRGQTQRLNQSLENQQEAGQEEMESIQKVLVTFKLSNNLDLIKRQIEDYTEDFSSYHKQVVNYKTQLIELEAKAKSGNSLVNALEDQNATWIGSVYVDSNTTDPLSPDYVEIQAAKLPDDVMPVVRNRRKDAVQSQQDLVMALERAASFNRNNPIDMMNAERQRMETEYLKEKTDYRTNLVQAEVAKSSLEQLHSSIDATSQTISLLTALPDEVLGDVLSSNRLQEVERVASVHLNKQQINPLWETLVTQRADVSKSLHEAEATIQELSADLPQNEKEIRDLSERIFRTQQAEKLVSARVDRENENNKKLFDDYSKLKEEVFNTEFQISVVKEQIASLDAAINQTRKQIETLRNSFEAASAQMEILELRKKAIVQRAELLTQKLQESLVAVGEELSDVSMASKAVPPSRHFFPPRTLLLAAMIFLTACVLLGGMSRRRYRELIAAS